MRKDYSIAAAARELNISYPTAKAIYKVFKKEKRIFKKSYRPPKGIKAEDIV